MKNRYSKKLTWDDVDAIRKSPNDVKALAKKFKVSINTIYGIQSYRYWKIRRPVTAEQRYIVKLEAEVKNLKELLNG